MPWRKKPGQIDPFSAKRVFEAARYHELQYRSTPEIPQGPRESIGAVMFHLTTALSRMSGTTPGSGSGKMQQLNSSNALVDISTDTYPISNYTTQAVASGAYLMCIPCNGKWSWVLGSCAAITL